MYVSEGIVVTDLFNRDGSDVCSNVSFEISVTVSPTDKEDSSECDKRTVNEDDAGVVPDNSDKGIVKLGNDDASVDNK